MRWRCVVVIGASLAMTACSAGVSNEPVSTAPSVASAPPATTAVPRGSTVAATPAVPAATAGVETTAVARTSQAQPTSPPSTPASSTPPAARPPVTTASTPPTLHGSVDATLVSTRATSSSCASAVVRVVSHADGRVAGTASVVASWVGTQQGSTDRYDVDETARPAIAAEFPLAPGQTATLTMAGCAVTAPPADSADAQFVLSRPAAAFYADDGGA